jgi:hypothetical protein
VRGRKPTVTILRRFSNLTSVTPHGKAWCEDLMSEANRRAALKLTVKANFDG